MIFESRKPEGVYQFEFSVAQYFKRQVYAINQFPLIFGRLRAGTEDLETERGKFLVQITKAARVWSAAARTRDHIPFFGYDFMRLGIPGIEKDNSGSSERGEIDVPAGRARKRDCRKRAAWKMVARAIIFRHRKR